MDPLLKLRKKAVEEAVNIKFRRNNMRRLEVEGKDVRMPEKFNHFVKDISYSLGKIESETKRAGNGEISNPNFRPVGSIIVLMRDDDEGTMSEFYKSLQKRIFNPDGTVNLPIDYLITVKVYRIKSDGSDYLEVESECYVAENHEYSGNDEEGNSQGTFSITFQKYSSIGK